MEPESFESQGHYICSVFSDWERRNPEINNLRKLHSLLDIEVSYQVLRRFISGKGNDDFSLFEAVLRAMSVSQRDYATAITRWYPSMAIIAERIVNAGKKVDKLEHPENKYFDLYQRLITSEPLTKSYIEKEWGRTGVEVAELAIKRNQIVEREDGYLKVNSQNETIFLGPTVVQQLTRHNAREYAQQVSASELDLSRYRVFFLTKEKAEEFKAKAEDLYLFIDNNHEESPKGNVVFAMQTLFRAIHFI